MSRKTQWTLIFIGLLSVGGVGSYVAAPLLRGQAPAQAPAQVVVKEPWSFRDVAKQVLPAVVSIETKNKSAKVKQPAAQQRRRQLPDNLQVPEEFRKFFEEFDQFQFETPDRTPQ